MPTVEPPANHRTKVFEAGNRFSNRREFSVSDYDLAATLSCGQAFRWHPNVLNAARARPVASHASTWTGVVHGRWVRLTSCEQRQSILAETAEPQNDWIWLTNHLQLDVDLAAILATFPDDEPMREAVAVCRGLRLLRQEPWECLASFICSSTKQIVQIQQIIRLLCERLGTPIAVPSGEPPAFAFPAPETIAEASESELRACLMGFRAPYLKATAEAASHGAISLDRIGALPLEEARTTLMKLPGVGRKIADCVLLFAYGFPTAFPIDVWVLKALRELYFPRRRPTLKRLRHFSETHFGPHGGYAQQYLFHFMRRREKRGPQRQRSTLNLEL